MNGTRPIREESSEMFEALRDPAYSNFLLMSVTYDGQPTEAICAFEKDEATGNYAIHPLAVLVTESMMDRLRDTEGDLPGDHSLDDLLGAANASVS